MDKKIPAFDERFFLLTLLCDYEFKNDQEIRFIGTHIFDSGVNSRLATWFPGLVEKTKFKCTSDDRRAGILSAVKMTSHADQWFQEGVARDLVKKANQGNQYVFTQKGYEKALEYQQPFKSFFKHQWEVNAAKLLAVVVAASAGVSAFMSVLQYFK